MIRLCGVYGKSSSGNLRKFAGEKFHLGGICGVCGVLCPIKTIDRCLEVAPGVTAGSNCSAHFQILANVLHADCDDNE
jgi:hypothetical protein